MQLPFGADGFAPIAAVHPAIFGQELHAHALRIGFRHGINAELYGKRLRVHRENGSAKIRRKRVLLVEDILHLVSDAVNLPVDVVGNIVDGIAQVPVIVVQPFQAGKQADDAI